MSTPVSTFFRISPSFFVPPRPRPVFVKSSYGRFGWGLWHFCLFPSGLVNPIKNQLLTRQRHALPSPRRLRRWEQRKPPSHVLPLAQHSLLPLMKHLHRGNIVPICLRVIHAVPNAY